MTWQSDQEQGQARIKPPRGGWRHPPWMKQAGTRHLRGQRCTGVVTANGEGRTDRCSDPGRRKRQETAIDRIVKLILMSRLSALWFAAMPASRSSRSGQWRAGQGPAGRAAAIGTPREQHSDPPHVILQCRPDSMHSINVPAALVGRAG